MHEHIISNQKLTLGIQLATYLSSRRMNHAAAGKVLLLAYLKAYFFDDGPMGMMIDRYAYRRRSWESVSSYFDEAFDAFLSLSEQLELAPDFLSQEQKHVLRSRFEKRNITYTSYIGTYFHEFGTLLLDFLADKRSATENQDWANYELTLILETHAWLEQKYEETAFNFDEFTLLDGCLQFWIRDFLGCYTDLADEFTITYCKKYWYKLSSLRYFLSRLFRKAS